VEGLRHDASMSSGIVRSFYTLGLLAHNRVRRENLQWGIWPETKRRFPNRPG